MVALVVVGYVGSIWRTCVVTADLVGGWQVIATLGRGHVQLMFLDFGDGRKPLATDLSINMRAAPEPFVWWFVVQWPAPESRAWAWVVGVPLWSLLVLAGVPGFFLWRRHLRERRAGGCAACGYSLVGLAGAKCPECGAGYLGKAS